MKCNYETLLSKVGLNKLSKEIEVTLEALEELPDCRVINTKRYIKVVPTNSSDTPAPVYNKRQKPDNQFECNPSECKTTGTLVAGVAGTVEFRAQFGLADYAAGVIAFYVNNIDASTQTISVTIASDKNFTNADTYTVSVDSLVQGADGYYAVIVDLSQTPTAVIGEGWEASNSGAYIKITTDATMGISTISFYESMKNFETSSVVKIGCLTELGTDFAIDAAEATCLMHGYDTSTDPTIERTITGNMVTPNYWILNPMLGKGKNTEGFIPTNIEATVKEGDGYGIVVLDDMNQNECGWLTVALNDNCSPFEGLMHRLTVPSMVTLTDESDYFTVNNEDGTTTLYFSTALIGTVVTISYPKLVEVEEMVGGVEFIGSRKFRYTETITYSDGTQEVTVFDNVLVTSFPYTINEDETEFSFTINIQKDKTGHFMRKMRVLD